MKSATSAALTVLLLGAPSGAGAEPETREVIPNADYRAGPWHQSWFGTGYRELWTNPVTLPVLDLQAEAGGLTPIRQVGGMQTPGLALEGADGRAYTFRNLIKEPERILPPEWRGSVPAGLFRDQMSAAHPGVAPIFSHIARSVGLIYHESRLMVMPDDPALGEFRKTFANQVGTFDTFPLPGVDGITEIVSSGDFWHKWLEGPHNRVDSRQVLKARLLDLATGNWDRHRNQWRWARVEGKTLWQPVPEDPDQCFSKYGGKALGWVRLLQPKLMDYSGEYPGRIEGLTYNNGDINRWLLTELDWPVYEEVARELQALLTDELINEAMRQVPAVWYEKRGPEMAAALRERRDGLVDYARVFYEHLAGRVDVRGSDADEIARVTRHGDESVEVSLSTQRADGTEGEAFYHRRFSPEDTEEIRIYLHGGDDQLIRKGSKGGINVIVLGGPGDDTLDDSQVGGADLRDDKGNNTFLRGPGSEVRQKPWKNPVDFEDGQWMEPRSYGSWTAPVAQLWWEPTQRLMIGGGFSRTSWAFRRAPWSTLHRLTAVYSVGYQNARVEWSGQRRLSASRVVAATDLKVSGIEDMEYFGFGNDTEEIEEELWKTRTGTFSVFPSLRLQSHKTEFLAGAEFKAIRVTDEDSLVAIEQPYGSGNFEQLLLHAGFELDSRGRAVVVAGLTPSEMTEARARIKVSGLRLVGEGFYAPKAVDVEEAYGGIEGSLSGYLGNRTISFAARVGGRHMYGVYPWFESASIGGSDTVRGYYDNRFRGDSSLYGNAELRLWLGKARSHPILPVNFGVFAFADVGRVWLEGEDSDTWHPGYGGGLMARLIGVPLMVSVSAAWGDEGTRIHFVMGNAF